MTDTNTDPRIDEIRKRLGDADYRAVYASRPACNDLTYLLAALDAAESKTFRIERLLVKDSEGVVTQAAYNALVCQNQRLKDDLDRATQPAPDVAEVVEWLRGIASYLSNPDESERYARAADALARVAAERDAAVEARRAKAEHAAAIVGSVYGILTGTYTPPTETPSAVESAALEIRAQRDSALARAEKAEAFLCLNEHHKEAEAEIANLRAENAALRQGVITEGDYDARTMRVSYSTGDSRVTIGATLGDYLDNGGTLAPWVKGGNNG